MTSLHLLDEKSARSWQVWPRGETVPAGAIHELGSYLFELRHCDEANGADLLLDERHLEALRCTIKDRARWRWQPGFHAGTVQLELKIPGLARSRFEVTTDPDLRKLTRDHFDTMVREVIEDTLALFSLSSFRKGVARGNGNRPPAIARLEFLRSRIEELEQTVQAIARNPRKRLTAEEQLVPYFRATHATGQEIQRSFRSGKVARETAKPARLPSSLRGFLPAVVRIRRKLNSTDIPENRQIAASLRRWSAWLSAAAEQLQSTQIAADLEAQQDTALWARRCRVLAERTGRLANTAPFVGCTEAAPRLTLSAVFRNDPAYRRFYRLWQDMNCGIAAVFGEFLDMPLARTWELYELWCFLRLLRAAIDVFGADAVEISRLIEGNASGGLTLTARAVTVSVGSGWSLCFQKQYREFWIEPERRGSYSRTMMPDIVMKHENSDSPKNLGRLIVLDAKYRIDTGLNAAISSIHTYRDALVSESTGGRVNAVVSAAYLLTPHVELQPAGGSYRDVELPGRLFRPDYRAAFRFGAVTLKPGMSGAQISVVLHAILKDALASA